LPNATRRLLVQSSNPIATTCRTGERSSTISEQIFLCCGRVTVASCSSSPFGLFPLDVVQIRHARIRSGRCSWGQQIGNCDADDDDCRDY
jgi:hypothetical protein